MTPSRERTYTVLRHHDFRWLWGSELLAMVGAQIQRVAIIWHVYDLTGDPLALGLLGLCRFVPIMAFGLIGGVLADRGDRRRTLILTYVALAVVAVALAGMTATGTISLLALYAVTVVIATVEGVGYPTRQAILPLVVPRAALPAASALVVMAFNLSMVAGPPVAGSLIGGFGLTATYAVGAVLISLAIPAVLAIRTPIPTIVTTVSGIDAFREAWAFLRQTPVLLGVMSADFIATLFGATTSLMPIFANEILGTGPGGLGLLLAAPAVGAVGFATILTLTRVPDRAGLAILAAIVVFAAALVGIGFSRNLWLTLVLLAVTGAADILSTTLRHAMRNLLTPEELRGRVAAAHRTLAAGGPQLGDLRAGLAASLVGAGPAVALGGCAVIAATAIIARALPALPAFRFSQQPSSSPVRGEQPPG